MPSPSDREALKEILLRRSVRRGEFKLVSGRTSSVYIDGKLTTLAAAAMPLIGRLFLEKMEQHGWSAQAIGGLSLGADPIVTAVARESLERGRVIDAFLVRKEAKKHGTQKFIEGIEQTEGLAVVIVDDVCTTGGSTADAIVKAKEAGMRVLGAICLVDREAGAQEMLKDRFDCDFDWIFRLSELLEPASADLAATQLTR
ncbi:MAG TPA: orotate phosphoribosyltransferase [Bryobacteraceae bacterium]|nr:orotate phosphoribosyltransferase [Bryobacteraceae bacterium]